MRPLLPIPGLAFVGRSENGVDECVPFILAVVLAGWMQCERGVVLACNADEDGVDLEVGRVVRTLVAHDVEMMNRVEGLMAQ